MIRAREPRDRDNRSSVKIGDVELCWSITGRHHVENAMAAIAAAQHLDVPLEASVEALSDFQMVDGRQAVKRVGSQTLVDDTYNANPVSCQAAINALNHWSTTGRKWFVLGDLNELGEQSGVWYQRVGEALRDSHIDHLVLCGEGVKWLGEWLKSQPTRLSVTWLAFDAVAGHIAERIDDQDVVWFKASRTMRFERLVDDLEARLTAGLSSPILSAPNELC
jgi:UDP-N-acetylmuramoyl-tripeptide--D-alanyl-D-alanine ligase